MITCSFRDLSFLSWDRSWTVVDRGGAERNATLLHPLLLFRGRCLCGADEGCGWGAGRGRACPPHWECVVCKTTGLLKTTSHHWALRPVSRYTFCPLRATLSSFLNKSFSHHHLFSPQFCEFMKTWAHCSLHFFPFLLSILLFCFSHLFPSLLKSVFQTFLGEWLQADLSCDPRAHAPFLLQTYHSEFHIPSKSIFNKSFRMFV